MRHLLAIAAAYATALTPREQVDRVAQNPNVVPTPREKAEHADAGVDSTGVRHTRLDRPARDPDAESLLHRIVDETRGHRNRFVAGRVEPDVPRIVGELVSVYKSRLPAEEQVSRFLEIFGSAGIRVPVDRCRQFVAETAEAWKVERGPKGLAHRFVAEILECSPSKVEKLRTPRTDDDPPWVFAPVAFRGAPSDLGIAKYVLRLVGWTEAEIAKFDHLVLELRARRGASSSHESSGTEDAQAVDPSGAT